MRTRLLHKAVIAFAVLAVMSGCAVGNKHRYHDALLDMGAPAVKSAAAATLDDRGYVKSGEKAPTFVGLQRGGFGNPFNVSTASGMPLAEDMTAAITASLQSKGVAAKAVAVLSADDRKVALNKLIATGGDRLILLILREWKSDTYQNTKLTYDVTLAIYDKKGKLLGEASMNDSDNLGGSAWDPAKHARQAVPKAFKEKIEKLFNDPKIVSALRGP